MELKHVWVYMGHDGVVLDSEASFHGKILKGLLKDRSNLADGTHVVLYSQPGKHAFSPIPIVFELLPDLYRAANEQAGIDGLIVNEMFKDHFSSNEVIDTRVKQHLQSYAFTPSLEFKDYRLKSELMMPWNRLFELIPVRITERLSELGIG
ncbi:hypothetical protein [Paenibacillus lentus]|uniref:hypothetical protein n=1 Tax=Paenibacillus lentus TaxID=1338368 RepID=UPI001FEAD5BD|nr:hypothetical protein [Paenibacillus lentus]